MGEGYDAATSELAGPWDIAPRAHILLRSSEFGLSGFQNYVQKGVNEGRRSELVGGGLIREKVSIEELTSGNRRKEVSAIRGRIAIGLAEKYGIALAEVARRVGVSTSAISKIMQRANK